LSGDRRVQLRQVGDQDKTIPSCLDISSPTIAKLVLQQSVFSTLKKTDWPKLDRFQVFGFRHLKCSESECRITAGKPVRTDGVVRNLTQHF
jgi:hypothetical protein